jgi:putative hydrolase of the HAD superfamily
VTVILFDFFGTLVDYSSAHTGQDHARSHDLLRGWGAEVSYPDYLAAWSKTWDEFERLSEESDREFSVVEAATVYVTEALGRAPDEAEVEAFATAYVSEWSAGVRYPPDVVACVRDLARDHRLAVVTNTHQPDLVPGHLDAMGLLPLFETVVTSVEVGWRKPHPRIYATALEALGVDADAAVFVGDTYTPDYVGPERAGITAFLIDPHRRSPVPEERRLTSVVELPSRLGTAR